LIIFGEVVRGPGTYRVDFGGHPVRPEFFLLFSAADKTLSRTFLVAVQLLGGIAESDSAYCKTLQ